MPDVEGSGGVVEGEHGVAAGHGFGGDVAVGFGLAWVEEDVGGRVDAGEAGAVFERNGAGEMGVGHGTLEIAADGAVSGNDELSVWIRGADGFVGTGEQLVVFFGGEAADVYDDGIVWLGAPALAEGSVAPGGVEGGEAYAAAEYVHVAEALGGELVGELSGGGHGAASLVVYPAEEGEDGTGDPGGVVVLAVAMEVGVEGGGDGDAEDSGGADGGEAERAFGGDVDDVGPVAAPGVDEAVAAG